jgi:uroporphyrinogen decarboxylase
MNDQVKALKWERPGRIPARVGILPTAWMKHREALDEIVRRYPAIFGESTDEKRDYDAVGGTYVAGEHVDAWGCVWSNLNTGMEAIVTHHPVPSRADVHSLEAPEQDVGLPHGFMYLRLADLRGFEELMLDFAEEPPELQMLIDTVREYNIRQSQLIAKNMTEPGGIIYFGDDLGMQNGLAMSPSLWRKYLKPCFTKIFKPVKDTGQFVYLHTDGCIWEIIPDLIDCGVDVVNPQIGANGLDNLVRTCREKICVDLDLDRQMFPFWTPAEIDEHIKTAVETLGSPEGGLWLTAEVGHDVPLANIEAICRALERHSMHFST